MSQSRKSQPIQPSFLSNFIIKISVVIFTVLLLTAFLLYLLTYGELSGNYILSVQFLIRLNRNLILYLTYSFAFQFILISSATIVIALFTSHKIAGPLIRLERICEQITEGSLPTNVKIRANDQIQSVAASMDFFVQTHKKRILALKTSTDKIVSRKKNLEEYISEEKMDLFKDEFVNVKKEMNSFSEIMESFQLK